MKKKHLHNKIDKEVLKEQLTSCKEKRITLSFYQYFHIKDPHLFRDQIYLDWSKLGVFGRAYVAEEGINAQLSIPEAQFGEFKLILYSIPFLKGLRLNIAIEDDGKSFYKLKIKVRSRIVADGLNDDLFDVTDCGQHLDAESFNKLTEDPNTIIVDMRNHYESEIGHFENAILPDVETFREALPVVEKMLEKEKEKNIILYCTGGIRCEKASAYYKYKGHKNVFQLDGGIIEYARQVETKGLPNKFIGKNFVFDERMGERISKKVIARCHQCDKPSDTHVNCANDACHILFIQCKDCAARYDNCCSQKCKEFLQLPEEDQVFLRKTETFNGTKFGKGRYKAYKKNEELF